MEQFRTSVSLVFWTEDTDTAQQELDALKAALPNDEVRDSMLSTIVFVAEGKPEPPAPLDNG